MTRAPSLTEDVVASAAACDDPRLREVFASLVRHLHAFIDEVRLTPDEWAAGIRFLTDTGHKTDDVRQEFVLLSDTLGASALVDEIANGARTGSTDSSLLGPFYTEHPPEIERGASIAAPGKGVPLLVRGFVRDTAGNAVGGAVLDVWETDGDGFYDTQYAQRTVDCRGRVRAAADGSFEFRAVVPCSYSIPTDGPVAAMLRRLARHTMRPAHLHFRIAAPGFRTLTTAIYAAGDPYLSSDAVFGVRASLIDEFRPDDTANPSAGATLHRDFMLVAAR